MTTTAITAEAAEIVARYPDAIAETTIDGPGDTTITLTISGRYAQGSGTAWVDGDCIASSGSAWLDGAQLPTSTALAALVMGY